MNTNDLISYVRNGLMEFLTKPIDDDFILTYLNRGYRRVYNHYARSSDNHFGQVYELSVTAGEDEYDLPTDLWSKRVDYLQWPTPGQDAKAYVVIEKIDFKDSHKFYLPAIRSTIPNAWAQLDNKIYIYPKPISNVTARFLVIPKLPPLKKTEGTILSFSSPTITTVAALSSEFNEYASSTVGENFLSVCNGNTGEIRHILVFNSSTGRTITITNPTTRSQYLGETFSTLSSTLTDITQDDVVVRGYGTGVSILGENFDEYLINYAILLIKATLNENDTAVKDALKEMENDFKSDRAGRPGIETIERLNRTPQFVGRYRRTR